MSDTPLIGPVSPPAVHLMTLNVRRPMPHLSQRSPDRWERRREPLRRLLSSERPTVLGVQEARTRQLADIGDALGADYRLIGRPVSSRGGEHCALFYDSSRMRLLNWRQHALSDTPDAPGSRTWGNWQPRAVVVATFADTATGVQLSVLNTHLDHLSPRSRARSAQAIRALASSGGPHTVVMGDFNAGTDSAPYRTLTADGALRDSWILAAERLTEPWGTYHRYRPARRGGRRIDWILASVSLEVRASAVNVTRYDGSWPSDHAAVQTVVTYRDRR